MLVAWGRDDGSAMHWCAPVVDAWGRDDGSSMMHWCSPVLVGGGTATPCIGACARTCAGGMGEGRQGHAIVRTPTFAAWETQRIPLPAADPRQAADNHAQGHPAGKEDPRGPANPKLGRCSGFGFTCHVQPGMVWLCVTVWALVEAQLGRGGGCCKVTSILTRLSLPALQMQLDLHLCWR